MAQLHMESPGSQALSSKCLCPDQGCWLMGTTAVGSCRAIICTSEAGGIGSQTPYLVLCGCGQYCSQEDDVMCVAFPFATRFSGAVGLAAMAGGGPEFQAMPLLFLIPCPLCVSVPPIFRCTDIWSSDILVC